jgi:Lectin C-type domain
MGRGALLAVCALVGACSFRPGALATNGTDDADPTDDGSVFDGADATSDAMSDATLIDAVPCPTASPPGCGTGVFFSCAGSMSCFVLCPSSRSSANAETSCQGWTTGAHLASPTGSELACVGTVIGMTASITGDNVWVGLRQTGSPATPADGWSWLDGTPYTTGGWGTNPAQPDDYDGSETGSEDCGNLERAFGWLWNDGSCSSSTAFLCERP